MGEKSGKISSKLSGCKAELKFAKFKITGIGALLKSVSVLFSALSIFFMLVKLKCLKILQNLSS